MTIAIAILAYILLISTIMPLVRSDYWTFRAMEYPRLQKWLMTVIVLILWGSMGPAEGIHYWFLTIALIAAVLYQSYQIYPYTPLASREVLTVKEEQRASTNSQLSLLISNIYQFNEQTAKLKEYINRMEPDIVLLLETNKWWQEQMSDIKEAYPHHIEVPLENTYGMLFYSRLPIGKPEVRYLINDGIPSIRCWINLPDGQRIRFFGLHPKPPAPSESIRTTEKDKELLLVAEECASFSGPIIVAGDLNDVAWSYTTDLFQKMSRLLDPRRGRGFFNTFPVKYAIMRFPLDHIFCSDHFCLIRMRVLNSVGSDHFPVFVQFHCAERHTEDQATPEPDDGDKELAADKMNA